MSDLRGAADILRDVKMIKRRLRDCRENGDFTRAEAEANSAIQLLETETDRRRQMADPTDKTSPATQNLHDLAEQLADFYGSRGGIYRRDGRYADALDSYAKGRELEQDEIYRIDNTYNQVQWLLLKILQNPELILKPDPNILREIRKIMQIVTDQLRTTRAGDPWAQSDLGLLSLLEADETGANAAWDKLDDLKPIPSVYRSGLLVLRDLAASLPSFHAIQRAVARFESRADS